MGYGAEALLAYELARLATDAVGFIFYTYQCSLQVLNELQLTLCEPACLLF